MISCKYSLHNFTRILLLSSVLCTSFALQLNAQTFAVDPKQLILQKLEQQGFENLSISESKDEITLSLEPGIWKSFSEGTGAAIQSINAILKDSVLISFPANKAIRVNFLKQGVTMYSFIKTYPDASSWQATYNRGASWKTERFVKRANKNYNALDIVLYTQYAMINKRLEVMAEYYVSVAPCLEWNPWKGMRVYGQVIIPIINEFGPAYEQIRQGNISAHQSFRIENVFGEASVGCYTKNRWGVDLSVYRPLATEGFWSDLRLVGRVGYTGSSSFRDWYWRVGPLNTITWEVGSSFFFRNMDTRFDLRYEHYLAEDHGVKFEAIRYFKRATLGIFAASNNQGQLDGGFIVAFQIPTYKQKRWKNFFRITPSTTLDYEYSGAAFFYLGKKYSTYPGDNNAFTQYISPSRQ